MDAFEVLGDPVRRRILELLVDGERPAGEVGAVVEMEFRISQPAVSLHLGVLRGHSFVTVRADGPRRLYAVNSGPLLEIGAWLDRYRRPGSTGRDGPPSGIPDDRSARATADANAPNSSKKKRKKRARRKERKR